MRALPAYEISSIDRLRVIAKTAAGSGGGKDGTAPPLHISISCVTKS